MRPGGGRGLLDLRPEIFTLVSDGAGALPTSFPPRWTAERCM